MSKPHKGIVVICTYHPKPNKQQELVTLLRRHVPMLRRLGLASGYPRTLMTAANGTVVEIFEWDSEEASRGAPTNPEVKAMWDAIAQLADFVPMNGLLETQKPFAHFKQVENERTSRVIHFEIEADAPPKLTQFYGDVFGWTFNKWGDNPYWLADTGREPCPGIDGAVTAKKQTKGGVVNTIHVDDLNAAIKKVEASGGKLCVPRMPIPHIGWLAYGADPEGNVFGMMETDMSAK